MVLLAKAIGEPRFTPTDPTDLRFGQCPHKRTSNYTGKALRALKEEERKGR
jgi:hypothetical protein